MNTGYIKFKFSLNFFFHGDISNEYIFKLISMLVTTINMVLRILFLTSLK